MKKKIMKQAIEEIEKETPSVDKLLVDEEDDKKSENGEKTQLMTKKMQRRKVVIITKQGNQFYLEFQIEDENEQLLDITSILKVQFVIGNLVKTYDGISNEVLYDNVNKIFKVWVTEEETFEFDKQVKMDARVLFKGEENYKPIGGTYIESNYWYDSLKKEKLDV